MKDLIVTVLDEQKAEDIATLDLHGKSSFADYMVVATGRSQRHVAALADHISDRLQALGQPSPSIEGLESCDWVLVDAGDIVVHIFRPEVRSFYNLEKMWAVSLPSAELAV